MQEVKELSRACLAEFGAAAEFGAHEAEDFECGRQNAFPKR
jgi:hypothetical protein